MLDNKKITTDSRSLSHCCRWRKLRSRGHLVYLSVMGPKDKRWLWGIRRNGVSISARLQLFGLCLLALLPCFKGQLGARRVPCNVSVHLCFLISWLSSSPAFLDLGIWVHNLNFGGLVPNVVLLEGGWTVRRCDSMGGEVLSLWRYL